MEAHRTKKFILHGLDCANCAAKIEDAVQRETGLRETGINFSTRSIYIPPELAPKVQHIIDRIEPGVQLVEPAKQAEISALPTAHHHAQSDDHAPDHSQDYHTHGQVGLGKQRIVEIVIATALLVVGLLFKESLRQTPLFLGESVVFLTAYWLVGRGVVGTALRNVRRGEFFDENTLMTIATVGAILIQQFPEAVAVMLFYSVGEAFQDLAVHRSRQSIQELMDIRPDYAHVRREGETVRVSPLDVQIGEEIVIRPGEKIPLDGEVIEGNSFVDTSALTGESIPRSVTPGDTVLAGTVNLKGLLTVRVTKPFAESSVSKILELVENAGARKARTEKFITKFSRYYTPAVVGVALGVAVIPPLLVEAAQFPEWIYRALVLLVISCPCALVLSVPLGYFGGIGGASRQGILVKGAQFLDALTDVDTVVMDKTGTLTQGVFKVQSVRAFNGFSDADVLEYAAHAECFSNHPIAKSILEAYGQAIDESRIENYQEVPGHGIVAHIDHMEIIAGNDRILHKENIPHERCDAEGTVVNVAVNGVLAGQIIISDEVKPDSAEAVSTLKSLGVARTVMLTGDDEKVAREVARTIGIDEVHAQLLPEEKVSVLEGIAEQRLPGSGKIVFVGDGINDAPVLTRADVGIAMGGLGADASIEAADVIIMDDKPSTIGKAMTIARRTRRIVIQNIVFALGVKIVVIFLGSLGMATMWEAVFADVGVSLIAVLNATRALRA